jgi:hypothetical protein
VVEIEDAAARLVDAHWLKIEAVARLLHASGRLDEKAISAAIANAT